MMTPDALAVRAGKLLLRWDDMDFEFDGDKLRSHCRCAGCRADALLGVVSPPCTKVEVLAITPLGYGYEYISAMVTIAVYILGDICTNSVAWCNQAALIARSNAGRRGAR